MRPPHAAAGALALVVLAAPPAAPAAGPRPLPFPPVAAAPSPDALDPAAPDPAAPGGPPAVRPDDEDAAIVFDRLLPQLERRLAAARADAAFDPVARIEAEETAAVAEELLEEGEAGIAVELLERALALLPESDPE